jgi:hypothetical protein
MKRLLIKLAYKILQYYSIETMPYIYCNNEEYEVMCAEINPKSGWLTVRAERK